MSGVDVDAFQVERTLLNELENIFVREVSEDPQALQLFNGFALQGIRRILLGESDLVKEEHILSQCIKARTSDQYGRYLERTLEYKYQTVQELVTRKEKVEPEPVPPTSLQIHEVQDTLEECTTETDKEERTRIESKKETLLTKARVIKSLLNSNSYLINNN